MKKKTRFKGMTLMEIVISLAIYGLISLLLVEIMSNVNMTMRATTNLDRRLSYEAKYADNRRTSADSHGEIINQADALAGKNNHVVIQFNGDPENGYANNLIAEGDLYEVKYKGSDDDTSADTNYKFMIFEEAPNVTAFPAALPYSIPICFDENDPYPYDITNIVVNEIDEETGQEKLIAQLDESTMFKLWSYEKKADGSYKFNEDNELIPIEPTEAKALRIRPIEGKKEWVIRVDRNPVSMEHGYKKVNIKIFAKLKDNDDPIYKLDEKGDFVLDANGEKVGYPGNNFPVFDFNLRFCAFTRAKPQAEGMLGEFNSWFDDPGIKYVISSNLEVSTIPIDHESHALYYDGT